MVALLPKVVSLPVDNQLLSRNILDAQARRMICEMGVV